MLRRGSSIVFQPHCFTLIALSLLVAASAGLAAEVVVVDPGAEIGGTNGLAFDAEGRLNVLSLLDQKIWLVDPESGDVLGSRGEELNLEFCEDLAITPDGRLYYTEWVRGLVCLQEPTGEVVCQDTGFSSNQLALSDEGRLFMSKWGASFGALYELDPELEAPPRKLMEFDSYYGSVRGLAFGPDGWLYAGVANPDHILRIDPDSDPVYWEVFLEEAPGAAVACSPEGKLIAGGLDTLEVWEIDLETRETRRLARGLEHIDNVAVDEAGRVFVSDAYFGNLWRIDGPNAAASLTRPGLTKGGGIAILPPTDTLPSKAMPPAKLPFDGGDSVFVADLWGIGHYSASSGAPRAPLATRVHLSAAPDGRNLLTTDWSENFVRVVDARTGETLEEYLFVLPTNAARFGEDLIVAELGSGSLVRNPEREPVMGGLYVPTGIAEDDDVLYVADWASGVIWQVYEGGELLEEPRAVFGGLARPEGLALDLDGDLIVIETGRGRILEIDPESGASTVLAEGLELSRDSVPGFPPTWSFGGVAVDAEGTIWFTNAYGHDLAKLLR